MFSWSNYVAAVAPRWKELIQNMMFVVHVSNAGSCNVTAALRAVGQKSVLDLRCL